MRVTSGIARGLTLVVPRGDDVRPTADRTRQAIFSSLGARVADADVLDLFAGTGALGIEAASRGARAVTFVERSRAAQEAIQKNIAALHFSGCELLCGEVGPVLRRLAGRRFTIILADPPYGATAQELLANPDLPGLLTVDGVLVLESAKRDPLTVPPPWELLREAVYGDTRVSRLVVRGAAH
jgi:16S rRNA (guanine966-N2)-methyltransferase